MNRPRPRQRTPVEAPRLIAFHKPPGVLSQWTDDPHWPGLARCLSLPGLVPAGRLDADSEGLLLLTNDGALQARLTGGATSKSYAVLVQGTPAEAVLDQLRQGVLLADGRTRPAAIAPIHRPSWLWPRAEVDTPGTWLDITLNQGRNRQIRRMGAAVGHPVLRLVRYRIGPVTLDGLAPGRWRDLPPSLFVP